MLNKIDEKFNFVYYIKHKRTPTVSIGTYPAVVHALGGMDKDFELIAKDDEFGRKLQDINIRTRGRARRGGSV